MNDIVVKRSWRAGVGDLWELTTEKGRHIAQMQTFGSAMDLARSLQDDQPERDIVLRLRAADRPRLSASTVVTF